MKIKKGFTILEQMVSLGIISIILSMCCQLILSSFKNYASEKDNIDRYSLMETVIYINTEVASYPNTVEVKNDSITYYSRRSNVLESKEKKIYYNNNNKTIYMSERIDEGYNYKNMIAKNIEDFKVEKKDNIIYLFIKFIGGEELEECFVLKNI